MKEKYPKYKIIRADEHKALWFAIIVLFFLVLYLFHALRKLKKSKEVESKVE